MEGGSPDRNSVGSGPKRSSVSSRGRSRGSSSSSCKDFLRKFVDSEILTANLEDWLSGISEESDFRKPTFDVPFELTEIQNFDYALEGVSFQQLIRMPNSLYESTSDAVEATAHLAIEDFLHASVKGLWETFWGHDEPVPFSVACIHSTSSKFYPAEKAIARGKLEGICATAILLKNSRDLRGKWDQIVELALLRPDVGISMQNDQRPSPSVLGEALFFALRVLLARSLSKSTNVLHNSNCVFVLLVDSQYGGVVKVEGDVGKLNFDGNDVYECAAKWIKKHAKVTVSTIDRIWNKLGNANWGDIGTLQVLLATFHCMVQFSGMPKYLLEDLATGHSSRLQNRRTERQLVDAHINGIGLFRFQQQSHSPEIVEVQDESIKIDSRETIKLEKGSALWMEELDHQTGFVIDEVITDGDIQSYIVTPIEESNQPGKKLMMYVGSVPSHLESAWEDMDLWYQVQRQNKVLNLMKQRGLSSKYLPQVVASGQMVHPGKCNKPASGRTCGHPWCGTPILVSSPAGETVSIMRRNGLFGPEEALRCCHDCLSALAIASSAGIRHGDIRPENVILVSNEGKHPSFVLVGWGHAVLEERDRPSMNLFFSSTYALQEGKLCAASDAESLIYLLYYSCGGEFPELDSVEVALQWREMSLSKRVIQQKLGDISAVLKAFADYMFHPHWYPEPGVTYLLEMSDIVSLVDQRPKSADESAHSGLYASFVREIVYGCTDSWLAWDDSFGLPSDGRLQFQARLPVNRNTCVIRFPSWGLRRRDTDRNPSSSIIVPPRFSFSSSLFVPPPPRSSSFALLETNLRKQRFTGFITRHPLKRKKEDAAAMSAACAVHSANLRLAKSETAFFNAIFPYVFAMPGNLLKAVKKHIGNEGSKRHFRDYITEEFRKNASVSDQATVENKIKLAHEYTFLLNSVHHHKELLFSYNIAVDRSDEMKKVLNKSAASVGLQLPDVYQP
ncbi:hypothetical protein OPV22_034083 [Ensete ventricosum]|uniref:Protein kinase domain-containing protein n=1 Tax=Ensete ventricosum TaxID=4639 RepID=A0AAV8Q1A2_ENSVE|nr:hypothetical protein OPV22_034083 [Ensete ventricosum]